MESPETEPKHEEERKEEPRMSKEEKFFRFIFASSIVLASTRSDYASTKVEASETEDKFPQGEVYTSLEEYEYEIFFPDYLTFP
jgi:hypothetical protein